MNIEQEREEILKKLKKLWFDKGCLFSNEILDVIDKIKNKTDFEECNYCNK